MKSNPTTDEILTIIRGVKEKTGSQNMSDWDELSLDVLINITPAVVDVLNATGEDIRGGSIADYLEHNKWKDLMSHPAVSKENKALILDLIQSFPAEANSLFHTIQKHGKKYLLEEVQEGLTNLLASKAARAMVDKHKPSSIQRNRRI